LDDALGRLDRTFTALTGRGSTRNHGMTYGGRNLVYEDCLRDCDVTIGGACLAAIGPPLSIGLDSARWAAIALAANARHDTRYCDAQLSSGGREVDAHRLLEHVASAGEPYMIALEMAVRTRYQNAWQQLLGLDMDAHRQVFEVDRIADRAREIFATSGTIF